MENVTDIFIIGGGINGTAIAADAAGRGLSVVLCEQGDLAAGTSAASTKLIHGGLRYLEFYEFHLVRKALHEREVLLRKAPSNIAPLEFVLPHDRHLRPAWLIRIGLFLYDHLSKRISIPGSRSLNLKKDIRGKALLSTFKKGFSYYDCFADDARLVTLNALCAQELGANILVRTQFLSALREQNAWKICVKNSALNSEEIFYAKTIVNAAGPWVDETQNKIRNTHMKVAIKRVKGSHIVVPKLFHGDFAYILQYKDGRVIFAIPYQNEFTLIGTTDIDYHDTLDQVRITEEEIIYLCFVANQYFTKKISPTDVVWSYSGVRCLQASDMENPAKMTRDYKLLLETDGDLPLLTVIGGKITTHRTLAEEVMDSLESFYPMMGSAWTADTPLPGNDFAPLSFAEFQQKIRTEFPWLPETIAQHYVKNYGTRIYLLLENASSLADLGEYFKAGLYQQEIVYLIKYEWAQTSEDILWRRTKLGLHFSVEDQQALQMWMDNYFKIVA